MKAKNLKIGDIFSIAKTYKTKVFKVSYIATLSSGLEIYALSWDFESGKWGEFNITYNFHEDENVDKL